MKADFYVGDLVREDKQYPSHCSRGLIKGVVVKEDSLRPVVKILQSTGADRVGDECHIPCYALEEYRPMSRAELYFNMYPDCKRLDDDYPAAPDGNCLCAKEVGYADKCFAGEGFFDCRDCWDTTVDDNCVDCFGDKE